MKALAHIILLMVQKSCTSVEVGGLSHYLIIICKVLYIPGGAGFRPSTVGLITFCIYFFFIFSP